MENWQNSVRDIGQLNGRLLVFGGAYSNLQALMKLKEIANELKIESSQVINTGDIMAYCAQPNECVELIKDWGIHSIAGNVELQVKNDEEACGCNFDEGSRCDRFSQNWYSYVQRSITKENKLWLHNIPEFIQFNYVGKRVFVLHGSLRNTSEFIFESTLWKEKNEVLNETNADVILSGHSGLPFNSVEEDKYWLNAGVIGMPANDGTSRVWYMLLTDEGGEFSFKHHAFEYDHSTESKLMLENGLPKSYAETLTSGIWDNMEVLPEEEKLTQGVKIKF